MKRYTLPCGPAGSRRSAHCGLCDSRAGSAHLGVAVLAGLGGGHLHDLTGAPLEHNEAVLAQRRALHGVGGGGAGIARGEVELVSHGGARGRAGGGGGCATTREGRLGAPALGGGEGDGHGPDHAPRGARAGLPRPAHVRGGRDPPRAAGPRPPAPGPASPPLPSRPCGPCYLVRRIGGCRGSRRCRGSGAGAAGAAHSRPTPLRRPAGRGGAGSARTVRPRPSTSAAADWPAAIPPAGGGASVAFQPRPRTACRLLFPLPPTRARWPRPLRREAGGLRAGGAQRPPGGASPQPTRPAAILSR